jgi:hypothetical protein
VEAGTKRCPDCGEEVNVYARLCRFCRYDFETRISGDGTRRGIAAEQTSAPTPARQATPVRPPVKTRPTGLTRSGKRWGLGILGGLVAIGVIAALASNHKNSSPSSSSPAASPAVGGSSSVSGSHVYVVASKSFCVYTGVDDVYSGNGHVEFFLTVKNSGDEDGKISLIPVRHYTDGQMNESAMDEVEITVGAGELYKAHTAQMKYKAHEHEIESCGLIANGNVDNEIAIGSTGI